MERILRHTSKYYWVLVLVFLVVGVISVSGAQANGEPYPCIDVTKACQVNGGTINFSGTVTNCGDVNLANVKVTDLLTGEVLLTRLTFAVGESADYAGFYTPSESPSTNTVKAEGWYGCTCVSAVASATCEIPDGGEGCTPGYWKTKAHQDEWENTGYDQGDNFDLIFGTNLFDPDFTLFHAVWAKGGGDNKLARHGTAALLSAAHPDVNYPLTVAEVITAVQAGEADILADANELGCPID